VVSDEDRLRLERIVRAVRCEVWMVERARIVLGAAEGIDRWADRRAGGVFAADGGEVAWHRQLGEAVGISESQAHVILSRAEIKPHRSEYPRLRVHAQRDDEPVRRVAGACR
jgi:hypothetical protein